MPPFPRLRESYPSVGALEIFLILLFKLRDVMTQLIVAVREQEDVEHAMFVEKYQHPAQKSAMTKAMR